MKVLAVEGELYQKLRTLLKHYIDQTGIPHLKLELKIQTCILSESLGNVTIIEMEEESQRKSASTSAYLKYPYQFDQCVQHRGDVIGKVKISIPYSDFPTSRFSETFGSLPEQITQLLSRRKLAIESARKFGRVFSWLGESGSLSNLEKNLDRLARKDQYLVIAGEPSSGKIIAGFSVHIFSANSEQPFILANCVDWDKDKDVERLVSLLSTAKKGALYLRHFDLISTVRQSRILSWLANNVLQKNFEKPIHACKVIFSTNDTKKNDKDVFEKELNSHAVSRITLPTLNQRVYDIKAFGNKILTSFGNPNPLKLDNACWHLLKNIEWVSGFEQLELLMFKLVNSSSKSIVSLQELICHLPQADLKLANNPIHNSDKDIYELVIYMARGETIDFYDQHPALNKALAYVADNYHKSFDLSALARSACVSPSHLSYLLRKRLNTNFKQLLNLCRIEKSMILLEENPTMQITEISAALGFCDLSHFEKTFKKQTGNTPKAFRKTKNNNRHGGLKLVKDTF